MLARAQDADASVLPIPITPFNRAVRFSSQLNWGWISRLVSGVPKSTYTNKRIKAATLVAAPGADGDG